MRRIAIIGSGIAGLSSAWHLSAPGSDCRVTLYEAGDYCRVTPRLTDRAAEA